MQKIYLSIENSVTPVAEIIIEDDGVNVSYGQWSHQDWDAQFVPATSEFVTFEDEPLLHSLYTDAWSIDHLYALVNPCVGEQYDDIQTNE